MEQDRNQKLNLLKGFACTGVVFIHIRFPGIFGQFVVKASNYGVPVFFMIAGYYAFGKGQEVIRRRLIKIVKIFVWAYSLHFLCTLGGAAVRHQVGTWFIRNFSWKTPIQYVLFCAIDFAIPLWYLIAMIEIYILWLLLVKAGKETAAGKALPVLFVLQILHLWYCSTKNLAWFWSYNFLTRGMPWFLLGYQLHTPKAEKIKDISTFTLCTLAAVGCAITVIPTAFSLPLKFSDVGYIPYAFGLFVLTLKNPGKNTCKPVEYIGEHLSRDIYIFHGLIGGPLNTILEMLKFDTGNTVFSWCWPIIVLLLTIFTSWLLYIYKRSRREALPQQG